MYIRAKVYMEINTNIHVRTYVCIYKERERERESDV